MACRIVFNTRRYELAHGRKPKGFGCWAFIVPAHSRDEIIWISQATLTDCKRRLAPRLDPTIASGVIEAIVLP